MRINKFSIAFIVFICFRMLSIPASLLCPPKLMLKLCVPACLICSVSVAFFADTSATVLYVLCFMYGVSIAWQFGSMYSWLAKYMDLVVREYC